jgi:hypothetical protein
MDSERWIDDSEMKRELLQLVRTFDGEGIDYAVCGGLAVVLHGHTRMTRDIDLLILEADLPAARAAASACGFVIDGGRVPLGANEPYPRDLYRVAKELGDVELTLDLVLVNPLLQAAWDGRTQWQLADGTMWIVSREGLAVMKRLAGRMQDYVDLQQLGLSTEGFAPYALD